MGIRPDSFGLFWNDEQKIKPPKKVKVKRTPPERVWESPDYLPHLQEALELELNLFSDMELYQAAKKETLVYDIETYPNYVLFAFRSIESRKCVYLELSDLWPGTSAINTAKLLWILQNFRIIHFNGHKYDMPISAIAILGAPSQSLWQATSMLIEDEMQVKDVLKEFGAKTIKDVDQIDLIQLTANTPGLKVCAGRLHARTMQELPFKPGTVLSVQQAIIVRWYCFNDLDNTELLFDSLDEQIGYRESIGKEYGLDLRSHSDAQMAEAIIKSEIKKITKQKHIPRTEIPAGTVYTYKPPAYIKFHSPLLQHVYRVVTNAKFIVDHNGNIEMPPELENLVVEFNKGKYQMGIGGLHSQEESIAHIADDEYDLIDTDVTSYYPFLILNSGIFPASLGQTFLKVFRNIVETRVKAKAAGNAVLAEVLKIVVNGTFGKLGSMWSIMYAPDLMLRVTLTGQLSILMLVEMFELSGIEVTSVNTDGIVVKCRKSMSAEFKAIVKYWEQVSGLNTEETRYTATYSANINNYIAVYETPQKGKRYKAKGWYGPTAPKKNAETEICHNAVAEYLLDHTSIDKTIRECRDVRKFTSMRKVNGGAVQQGDYLGKVVRWYYSKDKQPEMIYALTGNRVSKTGDSAKPLMQLPNEFPDDIDFEWYIENATKILVKIGAVAA